MNRPNMDDIKSNIEIFDRPSAMQSNEMYEYILCLEEKLEQNRTCSTCGKHDCGWKKAHVVNSCWVSE